MKQYEGHRFCRSGNVVCYNFGIELIRKNEEFVGEEFNVLVL